MHSNPEYTNQLYQLLVLSIILQRMEGMSMLCPLLQIAQTLANAPGPSLAPVA